MSVDVDVIIVGAGAAGIAAAMKLRKTSLSFIILEARNRVGGRACTDHETFTPTSVDLGASWIHSYRPGIEINKRLIPNKMKIVLFWIMMANYFLLNH